MNVYQLVYMKIKLLSYVLKSRQRGNIILSLEKPKTPTQLAHDTKLSVAHVSRTLKEFSIKGIAKCLTPNEKTGRIYQLTDSGKEILKTLKTD